MNSDHWEHRFDKVVRETERNLAKAKGTLLLSPAQDKISDGVKNVSLNISTYQTPKRSNNLSSNHLSRSNKRSTECRNNTRSNNNHSPYIMGYQKELWNQEDEIEQLRKQISLLQQSNVHYEQEAKLLKSQVQSLKTKRDSATSAASNQDITREFNVFKSEVLNEIRKLKQETGKVSMNNLTEKEINVLRKDLDNSKIRQVQDMQEIKNEVENIRNRLVKVEIEAKSVMTDCKECLRKCQRLSSDASHFSEAVRYQSKTTSSQLQSLNDSCAHLSLLRSSVSDLDERLSSLEGSGSKITLYRNTSGTPISSKGSSNTRGSSYMDDLGLKKDRNRPHKNNKKPSTIIDELDLSLDLSLLSDIDDDEEITLDKSLDITQDDTSTFKLDSPNGSETGSMGLDSLGGDLISDNLFSDDDS